MKRVEVNMVTASKRLNIDPGRVLLDLRYGTDYEPSARMVSLVNDYLENAHYLVDPSYSYVIKNVEWVHGAITLVEDSIIFKSEVIARLLEQCDKVAVFALTIGNQLEETVNQLAGDGLVLQASVLDAIGSVATEILADAVQAHIGEMAHAYGLTISRRFSPGYCDWHIGQQGMLFWALRGNTAGIRLTSAGLMIPQKSISGIIGMGTSEVKDYNPCNTCNQHDCVGRR